MTKLDTRKEAAFYRDMLTQDILPWWLGHAMDREHDGILSCISDDGSIVSDDKFVWSQVRAIWTFAAAYNRIGKNGAYLEAAKSCYRFSTKFGRTAENDWKFLLSRTGETKKGPASIQCDAFALCAMVEYAKATGSDEAVDIAMQTYRRTSERITQYGRFTTDPYPIPPGAKAQRVSMQFSLAYSDLARLTGDAAVKARAMELVDDVLDNFRRPDLQASLEYVGIDNSLLPAPEGTYMSPGHSIETAWFQIENVRRDNDAARIAKACEIMKWGFERGWDHQFGGLLHGIDIRGGAPYLPNADAKIWWPHCEAMVGALYGYEASREPWALDWYIRTRDWSLAHFPDKQHGEWTQKLDRQGQPMSTVVALPVKDPFHLPRALIYSIELLDRLPAQVPAQHTTEKEPTDAQ